MEGRFASMEAKVSAIAADVRELKDLQLAQMRSDAVDHHILLEHERRSTQLEGRMLPLERTAEFNSKVWSITMGSSGFLAVAAILVSVWLRTH